MPADYQYTHISLGRLKALKMAELRYSNLHKVFTKSGIIDSSIIEQMKILHLLLGHAAGNPVPSTDDIQSLNELLGDNMGEIYQ
jgi:hypothetical protein